MVLFSSIFYALNFDSKKLTIVFRNAINSIFRPRFYLKPKFRKSTIDSFL